MDTMSIYYKVLASRDMEIMVFDWHKAAQIILDETPQEASAGLAGDWGYTGVIIYRNGEIYPEDETSTYLASTWATPGLELDGLRRDCYKMASEALEWDAGTYWPSSARQILESDITNPTAAQD